MEGQGRQGISGCKQDGMGRQQGDREIREEGREAGEGSKRQGKGIEKGGRKKNNKNEKLIGIQKKTTVG